jgi:hypothetical protein
VFVLGKVFFTLVEYLRVRLGTCPRSWVPYVAPLGSAPALPSEFQSYLRDFLDQAIVYLAAGQVTKIKRFITWTPGDWFTPRVKRAQVHAMVIRPSCTMTRFVPGPPSFGVFNEANTFKLSVIIKTQKKAYVNSK